MKKWLHTLETIVDKLIPFLLLALLLIITSEFAFHEFMLEHELAVTIIDSFIIFVFFLDLVFKYFRIRNFPSFVRASWLEIIAIFPFFLVFRLFEGIAGIFGASESIYRAQQVIHLGEGIEEEVSVALREGGRAERFARFLRPISRSTRFFKLENPKVRKETAKDLKTAEKDIKIIEKDIEKAPTYLKAAVFYEKPLVKTK